MYTSLFMLERVYIELIVYVISYIPAIFILPICVLCLHVSLYSAICILTFYFTMSLAFIFNLLYNSMLTPSYIQCSFDKTNQTVDSILL